MNKNGSSGRANTQTNKLNKQAGEKKYSSTIVKKDISGRTKALEAEKKAVQQYKKETGATPKGNIKPQVK